MKTYKIWIHLPIDPFTDLLRLRGTHRWAQSSNAAVVPKPTATVPELLELYRSPSEAPELEKPSLRERNLEAEVRGKIQEMGQGEAEGG